MQKFITINLATATAQHKLFEGREHLVVPVVAIKAGVLNGELVLAEEIAKFVQVWNRTPLTIHHPQANGVHVSANGESHREQSIGSLFDVAFIDNSLKGNLWLDIAKAQRLGGDALTVLTALEQGTLTEVSTGYFCDVEAGEGTFNGKPYSGIQRNIRPDHLALLPGEVGACSIEDGCGAPRINQQKDQPPKTFWQTLKARLLGQVTANITQSFSEVRHVLWDAIQEAEGLLSIPSYADTPSCYIEDVYKDRVIYSLADELYERSYTLDKDGQATLGERTSVVKEVRYLPATTPATNVNTEELPLDLSSPAPVPQGEPAAAPPSSPCTFKTNCDCPATEQHVNQEVQMDKKELVSNVLRVQKRPETERALYEALPDEVLTTLAGEREHPKVIDEKTGNSVQVLTGDTVAQPTLSTQPMPAAPVINADALYLFKRQEALAARVREKLSDQIIANTDYTKEQLAKKDFEEIEQIARNLIPQVNYGGRAFPQSPQTNEQHTSAPEPPPLVEPKQAAA